MIINNLINKFGYSEMYEWFELFDYSVVPYGKFVTFDKNDPSKIRLANSTDDYILGVTTINSAYCSDDPEEWNGKYLCNEYGDILLTEKPIEYGEEQYDSKNEFSYIATINDIKVCPIINDDYNKNIDYLKRSNRQEWIRVHLLGKCIVEDDGSCIPGKYCTVKSNGIGTTSPLLDHSYYVISRISDHTILILFR